MYTGSSTQISDFYKQKTIAFIGTSRNEKDFTRAVYKEFRKNNYKSIPVNPNMNEVENEKCYPDLNSIPSTPDAVILFTPAVSVSSLVDECIRKNIKFIWVYKSNDKPEILENVKDKCLTNGINLIAGYCPIMFMESSAFPHKVHRFFYKLSRNYPHN